MYKVRLHTMLQRLSSDIIFQSFNRYHLSCFHLHFIYIYIFIYSYQFYSTRLVSDMTHLTLLLLLQRSKGSRRSHKGKHGSNGNRLHRGEYYTKTGDGILEMLVLLLQMKSKERILSLPGCHSKAVR